MGNRDLALENHDYPDFLSYCVGLDDGLAWSLPESLPLIERHLKRQNCVGIKLYPGYCHYYVGDEMFAPLYELAGFFQKPVAIHTGETAGQLGRLKYSHPLTVDDAASRFPHVQFVLCHFGKDVYKRQNHCKNDSYCGLDCICVGTHEANPTVDQCTDCQSFIKK